MRKVLLVFVILLLAGLLAADRLGVRRAETEIGRQISAQYALDRQPEVNIHGFPFLTQAVGGEYQRIDVAIGDWTQQQVTMKDVRIRMDDVRAPLSEVAKGDTTGIVAGTATASAIVPYEAIRQRAPKEVKAIAPKGSDLQIEGTYAVLGVTADITAIVTLEATAKGIEIIPKSVGSQGVQVPLAGVQQSLRWTVPVTDLPVGSRISRVEVTPGGLRVTATARNVDLATLDAQ